MDIARDRTIRHAWLAPLPVLGFLLMTVLPIRFEIGSLQMTGLRAYLLITIPVVLPKLLREENQTRRIIDLLLFAHIIWMWVSIFQVAPQAGAQRAGSVSIDFIGGYLIARAYIRSVEDFRKLVTTICVLVIATLPLALGESLTEQLYLSELLALIPGISTDPIIDMPARMGLDRAQAVFAHPIHYGLFCSTATALFFICSDLPRAHRLTALSIVCVTCFLSLSSGALLSVLIQVALITWAWILRRSSRKWAILIAILAFIFLIIELVADGGAFRVFLRYATFSAHNAYWRSMIFEWGLYNIWANPVFGVGNDGWERPSFMRSASMDNFWLYIAVKYGVPAFLLLAGGYLAGIAAMMRKSGSADPVTERCRTAWIICFVGLSFTLATVHVWTSVYSYVFFLFGAGLWMIGPVADKQPARPARTPLYPQSRNLKPVFSRNAQVQSV